MPSGQVHNVATLSLTSMALAGAALLRQQRDDALALAVGMAAGLFLSPDLDLARGSIALYNVRRLPIVGKWMALIWRVLWWPYGVIVRHRSWISHTPILSTTLRFGYLALFVSPWWAWMARYQLTALGWHYALIAFVGLCCVDATHISMDNAETRAKRAQASTEMEKS